MQNEMFSDLTEKSEEFDALMSDPPKFYLRSGFSMIFTFLIFILVAAYFIDYSDYIGAKVKIVSTSPRAPIVSNINGRIVNLYKNNTKVDRDEIIGFMESTASTEDVLSLEKYLYNYDVFAHNLKLNDSLSRNFVLGELQHSFSNFLNAKNELLIYLDIKANRAKIASFKNEVFSNEILIKSLIKEKQILLKKEKLSKSQFERSKVLYEKGIISLNTFELEKQKYIDVKNALQLKTSNINRIRINSQRANSNLNITVKQGDETSSRLISNYRIMLSQLKSDISLWKKKYLLISPIKGTLVLNNVWASQQMALAGTEIGSIIPENEAIFALAKMPEFQSGKVSVGTDVFIYLNSYNFSEFGVLKGKVKSISPVSYEGLYSVEIDLVNFLKTDSGFTVPFTPELAGKAKIITERMNLLERLMYKIKRLFNREENKEDKNENSK